ncbi:hypothetical protein niasHT_003349 [Heterodera trifolii]|uniref:Uncharacterized protein n=1 Tax=Heterodera trifolii TaxID=157864 RepID=A0ABD2LXV3_9BILA
MAFRPEPAGVNAGNCCGTPQTTTSSTTNAGVTPNYAASIPWTGYCLGINNLASIEQTQTECNAPVQFCQWDDERDENKCSAVQSGNGPNPTRRGYQRWNQTCNAKNDANACGDVAWAICSWNGHQCTFSQQAYNSNPHEI